MIHERTIFLLTKSIFYLYCRKRDIWEVLHTFYFSQRLILSVTLNTIRDVCTPGAQRQT